jgi:hypothetical protein
MPNRRRSVAFFTDLYLKLTGARGVVAPVITGHLAIEFLLRRLIAQYDSRLSGHADDLSYARLIALSRDVGTVTTTQAAVLIQINQLRNKLAHQISYEPSIDELSRLYQSAATAFSDSTDGIAQSLEMMNRVSSVEQLDGWVLPELFIQITYDLHEEYTKRGGDQEAF